MSFAINRTPVDISVMKNNRIINTKLLSLDNLVAVTVRNLAAQNKQSVENFLNGHSLQEITDNIQKYGHDQEDVNPIIQLTISHAENILTRYNKEGKNLDFTELLGLKKKFPEMKLSILVSYALAKRDPQLVNFADQVLAEKPEQEILRDPHIYCNPLMSSIAFIDKEALKPEDIYNRTNAEDLEIMKANEKKLALNQEEIKKINQKRLSFLELEKRNDPEAREELLRQKYKNNFIVST